MKSDHDKIQDQQKTKTSQSFLTYLQEQRRQELVFDSPLAHDTSLSASREGIVSYPKDWPQERVDSCRLVSSQANLSSSQDG